MNKRVLTFAFLVFSKTLTSSSGLCCEIKMLSADVIHPLHAKQSVRFISTFCGTAGRICGQNVFNVLNLLGLVIKIALLRRRETNKLTPLVPSFSSSILIFEDVDEEIEGGGFVD